MEFQQYINNPTGTKSSVMSYRKMYEDLFQDKWKKIMVRENGHVDYTLYTGKNTFVAHLKIPSETVEKFYYDVVVKFTTHGEMNTLDKAPVEFFSNDPSFNYTFAYAFVKHKVHIPELISKMSKKAINQKPVEKNPYVSLGYVKTLYFAYIFMKEKGLFHTVRYKSEAKPLDWKLLEKLITPTEEKIFDRQKAGAEETRKLKKEKEKEVTTKKKVTKQDIRNGQHEPARAIGKIGKIGKSKRTPTGNIGKVKKI